MKAGKQSKVSLAPLADALGGRIFCIHAESRKDRSELLAAWQAAVGLRAHLWPATIHEDGRQGCAASHKALATTLKAQSAYALILEDDAVPQQLNAEALANVISAVKAKAFDVLWLGGLPFAKAQSTPWPSIRAGASWTTHAMIVSPTAQQWLSSFEWRGEPIDVELAEACAIGQLKGAWVYPSLFEQASTPSNVRRTAASRLDAFGSLLRAWTPMWRGAVYHQTSLLCLLLALLVTWLIASATSN